MIELELRESRAKICFFGKCDFMNATKMTLIATAAVLALYIFAMMNAPDDAPERSSAETSTISEQP